MELDDFVEPEVGVAVALTAAAATMVASPRVRRVARQGAVYGLAGLLIAGDRLAGIARNVTQGAQKAASSLGGSATQAATEAAASAAGEAAS